MSTLILSKSPTFLSNYKVNSLLFNTLRLRQNGRHFLDNIFKCIFLNENVWISITISLMFVRKGPINNITAMIQIMAWRWPGDKPLSETMMVSLLTHICVTRFQWFNPLKHRNMRGILPTHGFNRNWFRQWIKFILPHLQVIHINKISYNMQTNSISNQQAAVYDQNFPKHDSHTPLDVATF